MKEELKEERQRIIKILMKYYADMHPETGEYLSDPQYNQFIEVVIEEIENPKQEIQKVDDSLPF